MPFGLRGSIQLELVGGTDPANEGHRCRKWNGKSRHDPGVRCYVVDVLRLGLGDRAKAIDCGAEEALPLFDFRRCR